MLNKLRCYAHFQFSANKIAWSRLLIQIHILNDKQCRSRSVGFWRSQLIWIYTVCKDRVYPGSAWLGLRNFATMAIQNRFWSDRWRFWSDEWMHTLIWIFARPKCGKVRFLLLWLIKDCQATDDTKILRCKNKNPDYLPFGGVLLTSESDDLLCSEGNVTFTGEVELLDTPLGGEEGAMVSSGKGELEGKSNAKCEDIGGAVTGQLYSDRGWECERWIRLWGDSGGEDVLRTIGVLIREVVGQMKGDRGTTVLMLKHNRNKENTK